MRLETYFDRIERIDNCIRRRATSSPDEFAMRLGITTRHLYRYIKFMRERLNMPIEYSYRLQSYVYLESGELKMGWQPKNIEETSER